MNTKGNVLFFTFLFILFGFFGFGEFNLYLKNPDFSKDTKIVEAKITDSEKSTIRKKKVTVDSYRFKYVFTVGGTEYANHFTRSELTADQFVKSGILKVVYKIENPSINIPEEDVKEKSISALLWELAKSLLIALLISYFMSLIIASKLGWVAPKNEEEPEAEPKVTN